MGDLDSGADPAPLASENEGGGGGGKGRPGLGGSREGGDCSLACGVSLIYIMCIYTCTRYSFGYT
jgi:hypothetical protein